MTVSRSSFPRAFELWRRVFPADASLFSASTCFCLAAAAAAAAPGGLWICHDLAHPASLPLSLSIYVVRGFTFAGGLILEVAERGAIFDDTAVRSVPGELSLFIRPRINRNRPVLAGFRRNMASTAGLIIRCRGESVYFQKIWASVFTFCSDY